MMTNGLNLTTMTCLLLQHYCDMDFGTRGMGTRAILSFDRVHKVINLSKVD